MLDVSKASQSEMRAVLRDLGKVSKDLRKKTQKKFRAAANKTAAEARKRQPVRSGALRRRTRAGVRSGQAEIRSRVPYARISEFGGRHLVFGKPDSWVEQKRAPAIFPAVDATRADYTRDANRALIEALREAKFT